jgi:hypothetical protein
MAPHVAYDVVGFPLTDSEPIVRGVIILLVLEARLSNEAGQCVVSYWYGKESEKVFGPESALSIVDRD